MAVLTVRNLLTLRLVLDPATITALERSAIVLQAAALLMVGVAFIRARACAGFGRPRGGGAGGRMNPITVGQLAPEFRLKGPGGQWVSLGLWHDAVLVPRAREAVAT